MNHVIKLVGNLVRLHETRDPFKIASYEGIQIRRYNFKDLKGYYIKQLGRKFIALNRNLDEFSAHIVCAHELGHAMIHDVSTIFFLKDYTLLPVHSMSEREANVFAAELILCPGFTLDSYYLDDKPIDMEMYEKLAEVKRSIYRNDW